MAKRAHEEETVVVPVDLMLLVNHDVFGSILSYISERDSLNLMATSHAYNDAVLDYVDFFRYTNDLPWVNWIDYPMDELQGNDDIQGEAYLDICDIIMRSCDIYEEIKKRHASLDRDFNRFALNVYRLLSVATRLRALLGDLRMTEATEDSGSSSLFYDDGAVGTRFIGPSSLEEIDVYKSVVAQRQCDALTELYNLHHAHILGKNCKFLSLEFIIDNRTYDVDFLSIRRNADDDDHSVVWDEDDRAKLLLNDKRHILLWYTGRHTTVMAQCHYDIHRLKRRISKDFSSIYSLIDTRNQLTMKVYVAWQEELKKTMNLHTLIDRLDG